MEATEITLTEYHVTLSREQLRVIAAGLNELPYKVAAPLLAALQAQVSDEEREALAAATKQADATPREKPAEPAQKRKP